MECLEVVIVHVAFQEPRSKRFEKAFVVLCSLIIKLLRKDVTTMQQDTSKRLPIYALTFI